MNYLLALTKLSGSVETAGTGLSCLSFDHHGADLSLLERIERFAPELTERFAVRDAGAVVLTTCNRFEIYFDAAESAPTRALGDIARITGVPEAELAAAARKYHAIDAVQHLFSVTSGLESVVVGEGEIAGQVRRAIGEAKAAESCTGALDRLFQQAAAVSKSVKVRTRVQSKGRSLVRLALLLAESRIGDWGGARVLLIGTGAYAAVTLAALRDRGARRIAVHSPSGRAQAFAATRNVRALDPADFAAELSAADVVIACSNAIDPILDTALVAHTVSAAARPYCAHFTGRATAVALPRPRLFVDLGMPRNIAKGTAEVPGVELLDLEVIALHAEVEELGAEAEARKIVAEAAIGFVAASAELDAVPSVLELRSHVQAVLEDELTRAANCGAAAPSVQAALRHFAGKLLHAPSLRLRSLGRDGRAAEAHSAVRALFGDPESLDPDRVISSPHPRASNP